MNSTFFAMAFLFLCLPSLLAKLLRAEKVFPLVFVQLILGIALRESGAVTWLQHHGVDLLRGSLADSMQGLGSVGVVLMIALAGCEATTGEAADMGWRFVPISIAGFYGTFAAGSLIGFGLANTMPGVVGANASLLSFCAVVGVTLSVTALPVLVAILRETRLTGTRVGSLAVKCSMLDDVWLWLGIGLILSMSDNHARFGTALSMMALYLLGMFAVVRPLLSRFRGWRDGGVDTPSVSVLLAFVSLVCVSATMTDLIGLHPLFGAFVGGAVFPRFALRAWMPSLTAFCHTLLLPFYFVATGIRLQLDFGDPSFWLLTGIVTAAAVLIKFSSVLLAARSCGLSWRESGMLGGLMQCKGLMELVAINIFLDAGLIRTPIYSALAMMALVSTLLTAPAISLLTRRRAVTLVPVTGMTG